MNKQRVVALLLTIVVTAMSGCAVLFHVDKTQTTRETFYLTPTERAHLENLAIDKSDAKAAFDLGTYYGASAYDDKRAYKWFKIAKKLGDERADSWIKAIERSVPRNKLLFETERHQ